MKRPVCPVCLYDIAPDQTAFRISPDIIVHYRACKQEIENQIHVTGRKVVPWKYLLFALLVASCASFPVEPLKEGSHPGCHVEYVRKANGDRVKAYERVIVVGEYDNDQWKVIFPDRQPNSGWLPYSKSKVSFSSCPNGFTAGLEAFAPDTTGRFDSPYTEKNP